MTPADPPSREQIIEWAQQTEITLGAAYITVWHSQLERFAALAYAAGHKDGMAEGERRDREEMIPLIQEFITSIASRVVDETVEFMRAKGKK